MTMSFAQIAKELDDGATRHEIRRAYYRALRKLRRAMAEYDGPAREALLLRIAVRMHAAREASQDRS